MIVFGSPGPALSYQPNAEPQLERNEKFLPQDFAGMNRRKFPCHGRIPVRPVRPVMVDYLHVFRATFAIC
jgi:hypothetical protein